MREKREGIDASALLPTPYLKLIEEMKGLGMDKPIEEYIDLDEDGKWTLDHLREFIIERQIPVIL